MLLLWDAGFRGVGEKRGDRPRCGISCWTALVIRKFGTLGHVEICQYDQIRPHMMNSTRSDYEAQEAGSSVQLMKSH